MCYLLELKAVLASCYIDGWDEIYSGEDYAGIPAHVVLYHANCLQGVEEEVVEQMAAELIDHL